MYLSRLIGTREIESYIRTYSGTDTRHTFSNQTRPSVYPEEFSGLKGELIAIMPDGYMRLKKAYYWQEK